MSFTNSCQNEGGAALVIGLMFLTILAMLGTTAVMMTTTDMQIGANYKSSARAFYDADAGVNYAIGNMETGLKASPQTFSLPTVGNPSQLTYTAPSGFSFSISNVTMLATNVYSFTSTGSGPDNARAVVIATFSVGGGIFNYGIFGDLGVTIRGNGKTDSYNSSDSPYTWATRSTNGDIGTNAAGAGAIRLSGNAKIYGDARVGVGGNPSTVITTSGNADVVPPGQKLAADEPKDMTPLEFPSGGTSRSAWSLSGNNNDTLSAGTYRLPGISISGNGKGYISGDVTLYVTGNIDIFGNGQLTIQPGGSLTLYVSGTVKIRGNGKITNNTSRPEKLQIYGTSTCTNVRFSGNANIYGAIHTPAAAVSVTGNGDIYGSVIGRSIVVSGNGNIHYDEALQNVGPSFDLKLLSWKQKT